MNPNPSGQPVADDAVIIHPPEHGIDVITYLVDEDDHDRIGLALSIVDERLGEFVIPVTGLQAARLHTTLARLLTLTDEQASQIVSRLRESR